MLNQPPLDPSMLIGVPSIDNEHYALAFQLNRLIDKPLALPESEAFSDILNNIGNQIQAHFKSEEIYLKSFGMPAQEVEEHVQYHYDILEEYADLNMDLMNRKALTRPDVLQMIRNWIIEHILKYDIGIRKYVAAQQLE
jgi:hemerythrin